MTKKKDRNFKIHLPITRHTIDINKKLSYHVKEVRSKIVKKEEEKNITDFKIYKETKNYSDKDRKRISEDEIFEDGFESLGNAINRMKEIVEEIK